MQVVVAGVTLSVVWIVRLPFMVVRVDICVYVCRAGTCPSSDVSLFSISILADFFLPWEYQKCFN